MLAHKLLEAVEECKGLRDSDYLKLTELIQSVHKEELHMMRMYVEVGRLCMKQQNYSEAVNFYLRSLQCYGNDSYILNRIGFCLFQLKRYEESLFYRRRAIEIQPREPVYHWNMALTLYEMGRREEAIPVLTQALDLYEEKYGPDHEEVGVVREHLVRFSKDV